MRILLGVGLVIAVLGTGFFLLREPRVVDVTGPALPTVASAASSTPAGSLTVPEAVPLAVTLTPPVAKPKNGAADLPNQAPLANPPAAIHGLYITNWTAGAPSRVEAIIALMKRTGLNAVVIDIKDYSGYLAYRTGIPEAVASGAEKDIRMLRPNAVIKRFHDEGFYVIGRVTVFQDPILAKAHPEWALRSTKTGKTWTDRSGLAWLDPAGTAAWDYTAAIARDAVARGFDEVNFDYIRFASDGDLAAIGYPFWDQKSSRATVIKKFFAYLRGQLPNAKLSADLFGLSTVNSDDLGIGQVIENAYRNFDFVCPMVYPSHYAAGFLGYQNPAKYPYEVVKYSMDRAVARLEALIRPPAAATSTATTTTMTMTMTNDGSEASSTASSSVISRESSVTFGKLRPWLQAFDLGAVYTNAMIERQIQAVADAAGDSGLVNGWLLWDPANSYANYRPTAATSTAP